MIEDEIFIKFQELTSQWVKLMNLDADFSSSSTLFSALSFVINFTIVKLVFGFNFKNCNQLAGFNTHLVCESKPHFSTPPWNKIIHNLTHQYSLANYCYIVSFESFHLFLQIEMVLKFSINGCVQFHFIGGRMNSHYILLMKTN